MKFDNIDKNKVNIIQLDEIKVIEFKGNQQLNMHEDTKFILNP